MNGRILNERLTEELVRTKFRQLGYYERTDLLIEEHRSTIPRIDKLLKIASKRGAGKGYPEIIITSKNEKDFVFVVECKADSTKHVSSTFDKYAEYAVDGARLYADFLSKDLDVLFVGVSGQNQDELKISHYIKLKIDN